MAPTGSLTRCTTLTPARLTLTRERVAPPGKDGASVIGTPRQRDRHASGIEDEPDRPAHGPGGDPRRPTARAEANPRSGLDDELRLLTAREGHDLDLPDAHVDRAAGSASRRGAPSRASRAGPGSPPRVTTEVPSGVSASSARSSRPSVSSPSGSEPSGPRIEAESTASWVTPIGRTPSSSIRAVCAGLRRAGDRSAGTDEQVDRSDRVVVEHGGQQDPRGRLQPGDLLSGLGQRLRARADRLQEVGHGSLVARVGGLPSDASRRTGHVRDAGQAARRVQSRGDRAVRLGQRPDRAAGAQVDREDAEAACRGDRRHGARQRGSGEVRLILLRDRVAEQPLEVLAQLSALLAMRRRSSVADGASPRRARTARRPGRRAARSRPTRPAPPSTGRAAATTSRPPPVPAGCWRHRSCRRAATHRLRSPGAGRGARPAIARRRA